MKRLHLNLVLEFEGEVTDTEHIMKQVEQAIRYEADTVGLVSDEDEAHTKDVKVFQEYK